MTFTCFLKFYIIFCTKTISCNLDAILQRVEWITLMFFGAMFITMECLARLGLIKWIGKQTEELILLVDEKYRLALAIVIVLWVSINCFSLQSLILHSDLTAFSL